MRKKEEKGGRKETDSPLSCALSFLFALSLFALPSERTSEGRKRKKKKRVS